MGSDPTSPKEGPTRESTMQSTFSDDAVPDVDPTGTAGLLAERLRAWKHAVAFLEDYMGSVEKIHKAQAKEYERALKAISTPLREGHHFDQSLGGIAGLFENMRANTQALINTNIETEKSIKGSVLPVLERLHKEIKAKAKELSHGAQKSAKEVERARNTTQKQIELLGQQTAAFESSGGRITAADDPYVVQRGVIHRLHKQVMEENNHRNDLIAVQHNFQAFEAHIVAVMQQAMEAFASLTGGQAEKVRALYSDMLGAMQRVPPDFEWKGFVARNSDVLMDPNEDPRTVESISFPNQTHPSTRALIEGTLERKSRNKLSWGYSTGYYVVTPAKYLHGFKDTDNLRKDPQPEISLYLPEAVIGAVHEDKFNVKGKDKSGTMSSKLTGSSELAFKAHTPADAHRWWDVIREAAGATGPAEKYESVPGSPVAGAGAAGAATAATSSTASSPPPPAGGKAAEAGVAAPAGAATAGAAPQSTLAERPAERAEEAPGAHAAQESGVTGPEPAQGSAAGNGAAAAVEKETAVSSSAAAPGAAAPAEATAPAGKQAHA